MAKNSQRKNLKLHEIKHVMDLMKIEEEEDASYLADAAIDDEYIFKNNTPISEMPVDREACEPDKPEESEQPDESSNPDILEEDEQPDKQYDPPDKPVIPDKQEDIKKTKKLSKKELREKVLAKEIRLMYVDSTPEALFYGLYTYNNYASLWSEEADLILNGRAAGKLALLNKLRDGETIYVDRRSGSFKLCNTRLTIALMIQSDLFQKFLEKRGEAARSVGFLARCLVCFPPTTQGTRFEYHTSQSWEHVPIFNNRVTELLTENFEATKQPDFKRLVLKFTSEAEVYWIEVFNKIEMEINPNYWLHDFGDYASKAMDNISRVAAIFHKFEGLEGDISLDTLKRAVQICEWYAYEFVRIFTKDSGIPPEVQDANEMEEFLRNFSQRHRACVIRKNLITQYGPNQLRTNKVRRQAALEILMSQNKISLGMNGKTECVLLNQVFFPMPSYAQQAPYPQQIGYLGDISTNPYR